MMEQALLSVRGLHKEYDHQTILRDINLDVNRGEVIVIIGPSGCGKSTFLRCLNGLEDIQGGEIYLDGSRICSDARDIAVQRQKIGMVFQSYDLFPHMTILDNITLTPVKVQQRRRDEVEAEAGELLGRVGLTDRKNDYPRQLSGGQKQRVALAGILAMKPRILILDEATAMIDPQGRAQIMHIVQHLNTLGFTVVMITHFMEEAMSAQRILVMHQGRIALEGTPEQMLTNAEQLRRMHLDVPFMVRLSRACQSRGIPVSTTLNPQTLKDELCSLLLNA